MSQMGDSAWALVGLQLLLNERDDAIWPFHVASITGGGMTGSLHGSRADSGKAAISWYIGTQGFESTYGAAASIVVLLIWVYYSAQIVLFAAELTRAYANQRAFPSVSRRPV